MKKELILNLILVIQNLILLLLCLGAILINTFFDEYKLIGMLCFIGMGIIGIINGIIGRLRRKIKNKK